MMKKIHIHLYNFDPNTDQHMKIFNEIYKKCKLENIDENRFLKYQIITGTIEDDSIVDEIRKHENVKYVKIEEIKKWKK